MFGWAGKRKAFALVGAVVTLTGVSGLFSIVVDRGGQSEVVKAAKAPGTTQLTTTTAATISATTPPRAASASATRVQHVRVLPGERPPKTAKVAAYRGPQPTGRIIIPSIGLNHLTYEGLELSTIDYGPSHWPGTAQPGHVGNAVYPGHRVTHSHPFFDIDLINIGDRVTFVNDSGRYTYEVTEHFVVDDSETWIADQSDTPTMTIFACHPKHSARQRYVVKGKLIQSEKAYSSPPPANDGRTAPGDGNSYEPPPETTTTTTQPRSIVPRIGG